MKKSLSLILALVLVISMFASVVSADTAANPQQAFDALKAAGIVSGDAVKGANLDANMTRAEFSIVIAKLWSLPEFEEGSTVYSDLTGYGWAKGSIGAATKAGLLNGVSGGKFNPSGNVKLEEIAKVIATGLKLDTAVAYAGAGKIDKWAVGYIAAVIKAKLVTDTADFTKAAKRSELFTISLAGYNTILAMQPVLNAATFADGVDKSIDIPQVAIKIDGKLDDWAGVKAYDVTVDADGKALKHPGSIALAWDGKATMYAKGTIKAGDKLLAVQPVDGAEWWNDDAFEIFLNSEQPKDESENKALTAHYAINSIQAFTSGDLHLGTVAKSLPYANGTWEFEASFPIDEDNLVALTTYGTLLGKVGVELNSTGEFYELGRTGGFWATDNFIIFKFLPTATKAPTPTPTPTKALGPQPVLNAATFAGGVDKSIDIPKAAIKIDGKLDDWSGVKAYDVTVDADGKALKHPGSIALAWDGKSTMYAKGTIKAGDKLLAVQPVDGAEWWNDDAFEIFLNSVQPKDESENKALTAHYALNSIQAFKSGDLHLGTIAKSLPYKDGTWEFEASFPIDEDNLEALKAYGTLIGKVGVELNSTGEFYELGRTGGFWDTDNFIIFKFLQTAGSAATATPVPTKPAGPQPVLNAATFAGGVDKSIDIPKAAIKIDGTFDDWAGVKAYDVKVDADGKALKHPGSIALAWDGKSTLYAKGTITAGDKLLAVQPVDGAEWWNDDAFEIFLNSVQPKDESENKALTAHYALNSIQAFKSGDLHLGTIAKSLPYKDGTWTFEASFSIDEDNLEALKAYGTLIGKVGVELNSTGEFYELGRTGGFWAPDNFIIFKFLP